jgi:hypothetical protein
VLERWKRALRGDEGGVGVRPARLRGDTYQREAAAEEYVDFQGDTHERDRAEGARRGRARRDEDLYRDQQQREVLLDERPHPRLRQEFERDYARRDGQAMERHHERQKTLVPPNRQQTALPR